MKSLLFLLAFSLPLFAGINDNGDMGLWLEESFTSEHVTLNFMQRWTDNFNLFFYQRYEGIVTYKPAPPWEFGLGYAVVKNRRGDEWVTGHRYFAQAILELSLWQGQLEQRGRITYVVPNFKERQRQATGRYRVRYFTPWFLTKCCLNPWISNEFFFREDTKNSPRGQVGGYFQNRLRVGFRANFWEKISYDLYVQLQSLKQRPPSKRHWNQVYDLGLTTSVAF